jgi:MFS-type transporter involved in bile tolerance (Atg22 family)
MWAGSITIASIFFNIKDATIFGVIGLMIILLVGLILLLQVKPKPEVYV